MGFLPSTTRLVGPLTITITVANRIKKLSLLGRSAVASQFLGDNQIPGGGNWPSPAAIDIANGERVVDVEADSGGLQACTITVPPGGIVDVFVAII